MALSSRLSPELQRTIKSIAHKLAANPNWDGARDTSFALRFGKFAGWTIDALLKTNPAYVQWLYDNCNTFTMAEIDELAWTLGKPIPERYKDGPPQTYFDGKWHLR